MINNSVGRIISICNTEKKKEKYNILTFPTHERYETQLAKTGHNFYSFHMKGSKKWNRDQLETPQNYHILPEGEVCDYIKYDFILSQSKFWQFQAASQIKNGLNIPIISLEHTIPTPQTMTKQQTEMMKNMLGDVNVFISDYSRNQWQISYNATVIHHGIDSETFAPKDIEKDYEVLTVANDFVNRDYCLNYSGWKRVTNNLKTHLIGNTPGLSESAKSTEDLVDGYNKTKVYFNSSTLSPIPTSLLEAMSCGCAVVSTATCMIPEIIRNGENGFISNDETELKSYIQNLLEDSELRKTVGENARKTIVEKFSQKTFIEKWNKVFDATYEASIR
jgi:glycosyltransferase involved in cell wall biosynthesis